jgi:signal transduction histidine kinase
VRVALPAYSFALVLACVAVFLTDVPSGDVLLRALLWMPLIAVGRMTRVTALPGLGVDVTLSSIVIVAAAVLLPPQAVVLVSFVGLVSMRELRREAPLVMALFNRAQYALSGAAAAAAAALVPGTGVVWLVAAAVIASVVFELTNIAFVAVVLTLRRGLGWRQALHDTANPFPNFALNAGVSATLSLLLIVLIRDVGWWSVALLAAPLWLSHSAQRSAREAQDRAEQLADRVRELEMLNALSGDLLSVRTVAEVPGIVAAALEKALGTPAVEVDLAGERHGPDRPSVPVAGCEPAAIIVHGGIDGEARAVVEASAALVGLTLTRLAVEAELAETERARTALTGRILEEATHERSRIAMSVHDDVLPLFAAAQMKIDTLEMVVGRDPADASALIDSATDAVTDGIAELRDTLESLRQSTLVPGTLREGVVNLLAELRTRTGVRTTLTAPDPLPPLPFAIELLAFETLRGGLANVEKHAHATALVVELDVSGGRLVLVMQDDGRGFDPATVGRRSHGLALMRQRVELARGLFEVSGAVGAGTTVRLEVPTW